MSNYINSLDKYLKRLKKDIRLAPERIARAYLGQLAAEFLEDSEATASFAAIVRGDIEKLTRDKNELTEMERFREELVNNYDEYARQVEEFLKANDLSGSTAD